VEEIAWIRELIQKKILNRVQLSRQICDHLNWRKPDGGLKDMSCRVALLRMEADGLLKLPAPIRKNGNGKRHLRRTAEAEPGLPLCIPVNEINDLTLELVGSKDHSYLWNEYIDRYHYLGFQPLSGAQLRYFAMARGQPIALLGFGAAAWTTASRDQFIGWNHQQRIAKLHLVVNNARFLILPWINSRHLASKLISMATRRLPNDWFIRYGFRPLLLETFVEIDRFKGTCYKAANWINVGITRGRGKLGGNQPSRPLKSVWVFPLSSSFREELSA
jgi:hypothetical protein